jgi:hypothetical protein
MLSTALILGSQGLPGDVLTLVGGVATGMAPALVLGVLTLNSLFCTELRLCKSSHTTFHLLERL